MYSYSLTTWNNTVSAQCIQKQAVKTVWGNNLYLLWELQRIKYVQRIRKFRDHLQLQRAIYSTVTGLHYRESEFCLYPYGLLLNVKRRNVHSRIQVTRFYHNDNFFQSSILRQNIQHSVPQRQQIQEKFPFSLSNHKVYGKVIPLQTWAGPKGSRRVRFQYFMTIGTWRRW